MAQITREDLIEEGITDTDQQDVILDAQGSKNEGIAVLYDSLKTCVTNLRFAETQLQEGWIGYDIGFRKLLDLSIIPNSEKLQDSDANFTYRMSQHPDTLWGGHQNSRDQKTALLNIARNMHTIAANFGLPLQDEKLNWEDNKAYSLKYGLTVDDLRAATTTKPSSGVVQSSEYLKSGVIGDKMRFHHYVFTDNGSGGNSIDWRKTMSNRFKVKSFYVGTDENRDAFVDPSATGGSNTFLNDFMNIVTGKFPYIFAYAQQNAAASGLPLTVSGLQSQTSQWYQAVKWSFASNKYSMSDANIKESEFNLGTVDQRVIDEALEDATNSDNRQNDYLGLLSDAKLLSLGFTGNVQGYEYEPGIGNLDAAEAGKAGTGGWIKAPHSIQHHGTFEQIWLVFKAQIEGVAIDAGLSQELKPILAAMKPAAEVLIRGIKNFASAWKCIRDAVMLYLPILDAAMANIKEAFKDASGFWASAIGIIPGFDSISNTGLMNDLMHAIGSQDASEAIGAAVQRNIFKEQCFLLSYMRQLSAIKKKRDYDGGVAQAAPYVGPPPGRGEPKKALPYINGSPNSTLLLDGDPYGFLNKLTQSEGGRLFFNADPEVVSHLQPMIRLFKISYDDDGVEGEDEFIFESSASGLITMLQDRRRRGAGVGIKSFDFAYEGSNPFAVKKSISATLKVFASSMDELLLPRRNQQGNLISFADLALKTRNPPPARGNNVPGALPANCQPGTTGAANSGGAGGILAQQNQNLDKLTFRLKAVVGWATPNGTGPWERSNLATTAETGKELLYKGIWNSTITLNLTPTIHHFEFDEMGRTTMVIKYLAYVEDFYDQPAFNIFASAGATNPTAKQLVRNLKLKYLSSKCDATEIGNIKKNLAEEANEEKPLILTALVSSLAKQNKIYYLDLPIENIGLFNSEGPYYDWSANVGDLEPQQGASAIDTIHGQMREAIADYQFSGDPNAEETHLFKAGLRATDPKNENLPFVYVSDLVDCIMANIEAELKELPEDMEDEINLAIYKETGFNECDVALEKQKMKRLHKAYQKLRIVLGPLEIVNQGKAAGEPLHCTFGDVPISLKYLLEWITEKLSDTAETIYTLTRFLNDLFNKLITDFLNDGSCFNWDIKPGGKIRMNQTVITSYPRADTPGIDEITASLTEGYVPPVHIGPPAVMKWDDKWKSRANLADLPSPVFNISGVPDTPIAAGHVSTEMNYFIYFAGRVAPMERMNGDKETDEQAGIYHYLAGRNRGLIKNIKFNKTDSPGLAEVRFEQDGYKGLQQLRVLYDADIEMYANVKTFPGTYIFVDPRGVAPSTNLTCQDPLNLTQYGIGGYMMIIKSEHSFAPGKAETRLHAKWVNGISDCTGTDSPLLQDSTQVATPGGTQGNCDTNLAVRQESATTVP
jgi:hypothetical protein